MTGEVGWVALLVGAALLPDEWERRLALAGLGAAGLGLAAWRAGPVGNLPPGFAAIDAGLLLVGLGCAAWAAAAAGRQGLAGYPAAATVGLGAAVLLPGVARLAGLGGPGATVGALLGLAGAGVMLCSALSRVGRRGSPPPLAVGADARATAWWAALAGGVVAAGAGPHLAIVFIGALVAAVAAWQAGGGTWRLGVVPVTALATLAPAYWLFATIAGPEGLGLRGLADLPLSPAAESLLAPLVLLAAWALSGLWPVPRRLPAGLVGPAGLFLAGRVALVALPDGVGHWRPLVFPVLLIGLWQGAWSGRWAAIAVGASLLGLVSGTPAGLAGAPWLAVAAAVVEAADRLGGSRPVAAVARRAAIVPAGWGALLVLEGGLGAEVVYTAFAAVGMAVAVAAGRSRPVTAVVRNPAAGSG